MIRRFKNSDADEVSALIHRTMQICNSNDYPEECIKQLTELFTSEYVIKRAEWTHFYVICEDNKIIGCGAIGPYWDKTDESCFFTIFVLPEYQGKGYGRLIIEALEHDEFFLKSKRIEIPASKTGLEFYRHLGYDYKNGNTEPDDEGHYILEKFRNI